MQSATEPERYAPKREIRHAVVMYGGVSLAIYMYGVAEELRHMVCSTACSRQDPDHLRTMASTEPVYREVARLLTDGDQIDTRFVVDIIAGTSAGGINGICLAKALARDAPMNELRDLWIKEGDISALLNDERSGYEVGADGAAIDGLEYADPPLSLLSGRRMQQRLVHALKAIARRPDDGSPSVLVDELDLWVTATDLEGLPLRMRLASGTIDEPRHTNRYHFRYAPKSERRDDFGDDSNGFLAYAARATSAFPFAFDPAVLENLKPFESPGDETAWTRASSGWQRFHRGYGRANPAFGSRSFSDGGILDNKPFSYATESLLTRRAHLPVDRKLLFIEPDPAGLGVDTERPPRERWNVIDTAVAATLSIPSADSIHEDIRTVLQRNRDVERMRELLAQIDLGQGADGVTDPRADWAARSLADDKLADVGGPTYSAYYRLKVRSVVDWLSELLLRTAIFDPRSDELLAIGHLVHAWKDRRYSEAGAPTTPYSDNAFLVEYDLPFRMRRLDFLTQRLNALTQGDPPRTGDTLKGLRSAIDAARGTLVRAQLALIPAISERVRSLGVSDADLERILDADDDAAMRARAAEIVEPIADELDALSHVIAARIGSAAEIARLRVDKALQIEHGTAAAAVPLLRDLRRFYDAFDVYDLALYPLVFGTGLGEANPVDIVRISPLDAPSLAPDGRRRKLNGAALRHFSAFLDVEWRRHDIVWGRLDAAECLIKALLPGPEHAHERASLTRQAQRRIIADFVTELLQARKLDRAPDGDLLAWFKDYRAPATPDLAQLAQTLPRALGVVAKLLSDAVRHESPGGATAVIDSMLGEKPAAAGVGALLRTRLGGDCVAVVGAIFVLALLTALLGNGWVSSLGWAATGAAGTVLVGVPVGLYVAFSEIHGAIRKKLLEVLSAPGG